MPFQQVKGAALATTRKAEPRVRTSDARRAATGAGLRPGAAGQPLSASLEQGGTPVAPPAARLSAATSDSPPESPTKGRGELRDQPPPARR
ncbi:hypothetical protein GCM10020256_53140 [Streptomyces thermocoprophilus]